MLRVPLPRGLLRVPLSAIEGVMTALYGGNERSALPILVHGQDAEVLVGGRGTEVVRMDAKAVIVEGKVANGRRDLLEELVAHATEKSRQPAISSEAKVDGEILGIHFLNDGGVGVMGKELKGKNEDKFCCLIISLELCTVRFTLNIHLQYPHRRPRSYMTYEY